MIHIPILRAGVPYRSIDRVTLRHISTGEPVAEVSQANPGLIARDLRNIDAAQARLGELSMAELLAICKRAAELFMEGELPIDEGVMQSADDYVRHLSSTTGMPHVFCRRNMEKIRFVLDEMEGVLAGLTRGLDLGALDRGFGEEEGRTVSYLRQSDSLGAVLPSNSPGVHALWIPAIALKVPLVLKPGRQEPWTPLRIARALEAAGCPPEALSLYPTSHAGAGEILMRCNRSLLFGDEKTLQAWEDDLRVQLHGPGWSKVLLGADRVDDWRSQLDVMASSVSDNGGRSCINASSIWTPAHADDIAEALAERLNTIVARPLDHPDAGLAAFSEPRVAHAISDFIDSLLQQPGAEDVSARLRGSGRVAQVDGCTFLLPTVVRCTDPDHPLAGSEFLFPFVSVVEAPAGETLQRIGSTLVATALTDDPQTHRELLDCRSIDRLNLGSLPTSRVSWDQPHEGNLFDHLYRQRSFQSAAAGSAA